MKIWERIIERRFIREETTIGDETLETLGIHICEISWSCYKC